MVQGELRYVFAGSLVLETPLHIGGGSLGYAPTDHPILRTAAGVPTIPGSSLKGAFRSAVERLAGQIPGVRSCALLAPRDSGFRCVGPQGDAQREFDNRRRDEAWSQEELLRRLEGALCDTCWLFGSPYAASHVEFADLLPEEDSVPASSVRDGVAIDRDTGKQASRRKFDYEVVEPDLPFALEITLAADRPKDLALTCLGLRELLAGRIHLGGKVSRGLGRVRLAGLRVFELDLRDGERRQEKLKQFLLARCAEPSADRPSSAIGFDELGDAEGFVSEAVKALLKEA